jgi:hypothetical protein
MIAEIFKAGVRDPGWRNRLLRDADLYALAVARKYAPRQVEASEKEKFDHLQAGEYDKAAEVTRCKTCCLVKPWYPFFHLDNHNPSGHKLTCKVCLRKEREKGMSHGIKQAGGWSCGVCKERKLPEEFPEAKRDHPRRPIPCLACEPVQE